MSTPGGSGGVAETIISEMKLDASQYESGTAKIIAADNAMIASFKAVMAAHAAMIAQLNTAASGFAGMPGGVNPNITGSFGGATLMGGSRTLYGFPSVLGGPGGAFNPYSGGRNYFGNSGAYGGVGGPGNRYGRVKLSSLGDDDKGSSSGRGSGMMGFGLAYMVMRVFREFEHALIELDRMIIRISEDSLKQYASFNTLEKSFQGIYQSSQLAAQMMTYLRDTAMTSAFHFRDLADAARGISVAGLDVGRWLPITQGFALAMGKVNSEGLNDFVSILRRIQGGNLGVALGPRGIGRYGVSRAELKAQGGTFDEHGHFTGSINQALDAIERVFSTRIKGIADSAKQSFEVVLSNIGDAMQQAKIDFGHGLADVLTNPIKDLTGALNDLRQSGALQDFGEVLAGIVTSGLPTGGEALKYDFTKGPNGEDLTPAQQKKAMLDYRNRRFGYGPAKDDEGNDIPRTNVPSTTGNPIEDVLIQIAKYVVEMVEYQKEFVDGLSIAINVLKALLSVTPLGYVISKSIGNFTMKDAGKIGDAMQQEMYQRSVLGWQDRVRNPQKYMSPSAPSGTGTPGVDEDEIPQMNQHLKHIREHTSRIAAHSDSQKTAFGGGDIGRQGVFAYEMGAYYRGASGGGIKTIMANAGSALAQAIQREVHAAFRAGIQQGYVGARAG